jgi:exonuclease VII small subunit
MDMIKNLPRVLFVFGLVFTSFLPVQKVHACVGAFAAGYGDLFVPGIITTATGGAVFTVGGIGACVCGGCAACCAASDKDKCAIGGTAGAVVCYVAATLGGCALIPGIVLLDEKPAGFQFARLTETEALRLNLSTAQLKSFNENLSHINAVIQQVETNAFPLNAAEGIKSWKEFKKEFSQISLEASEAIEVAEILSSDLLNEVNKAD